MEKKIRILGIRGVPAAHGGFETFAEYLCLYLVQQGWKPVVYCQEDGEGEVWIDVWTGEERNGGETITVSAPLEKIPVFAKKESEYLEIFDNFS